MKENPPETKIKNQYIKKAIRIQNQIPLKIGDIVNLRKRYEK